MGERPRSPGFIQSISKAQLKVVGLLDAAGVPVVGVDTTAIHKATAAEISAMTAKATPTTSDYLVIEDAAAGDAKKRITIGDLPAAAAVGMTSVVSEINTTDATQTSFGALFSPAVASVNLCNIRVVSVKQTTGDWATFQWLGAVLEDSDNDNVFEIHNGTTSTSPDNSQGGASAIRLAIGLNGGSSAIDVKITAIAASNYRHRLVLEYSPLVYS
jgi:hypothetical protein